MPVVLSKTAADLMGGGLDPQAAAERVISDHAVDVGGNRTLVATHELFETSFNATDSSSDEIAVGSGGQVS